MRAIDDGSRRPSLPANVYPPAPTITNSGSKASSSSPPPHGTISPSSPSDQSTVDSEADPEDPDQADFDTDVEFDPPLPDNASQHTFGGGGGFDHYGSYRKSMRSDISSIRDDYDDDGDYHYRDDSTSPVAFTRHPYDGEGPDVDTLHIGPSSASSSRFSRRGSMPLNIPTSPRDREDSMATITAGRRPSRSYEDGTKMLQVNVQPSSLPENRTGLTGLAGDGEQGEHDDPPMTQEPETNVYDGLDITYILSGPMSGGDQPRRSWSSGAPSYVAKDRMRSLGNLAEGGNMGESLSWMWSGPGPERRPSTATVLSAGEDVFTRHLRKNDMNYNVRRVEWSFKKESTDGMGPRVPPTPGGEEGEQRRTMEPGMQEIWRHAYIGRFKVDRLLIRCECASFTFCVIALTWWFVCS